MIIIIIIIFEIVYVAMSQPCPGPVCNFIRRVEAKPFLFFSVFCEWRGVSSSLNDTLLTLAQNSPSAQSSGEESAQSSKFELPKCRLVVLPPGELWAKKGEKGEKTKRRKGEKA